MDISVPLIALGVTKLNGRETSLSNVLTVIVNKSFGFICASYNSFGNVSLKDSASCRYAIFLDDPHEDNNAINRIIKKLNDLTFFIKTD